MIQKLVEEMKLRGFTQKIQKAYLYHTQKFLESKLSKREYLLFLIKNNKSLQSIRLATATITFYETYVLKINSEYVLYQRNKRKFQTY